MVHNFQMTLLIKIILTISVEPSEVKAATLAVVLPEVAYLSQIKVSRAAC